MTSKLTGERSGVLCLILALCSAVLIGQETAISIVTIVVLGIQVTLHPFLFHNRNALLWLYIGTAVAEIVFLITNAFAMLALAGVLLLIIGIWTIFGIGRAHQSAKRFRIVRHMLYGSIAFVASVFWIVNIYTLPITQSITLPAEQTANINQNQLDSPATMLSNIEIMNSFGSRTTGSVGQQQFIGWVEQQLTEMGITIHRDKYILDRWEAKHSSIMIDNEQIDVASAFPYSGETDEYGVTGQLVYTGTNHYEQASGNIAVVEVNNFKHFPMGLVMNMREAVRAQDGIPAGEGDLVLTTALKHAQLETAKQYGVKAVILVWNGVSDAKAEQQYIPFTEQYASIPAVWVNHTEGQKVIRAAKEHKLGTVILEADKQHAAPTESFYVKIAGKNDKESIIINTHTDGVNVVEENGALGMLSMIRYLQQQEKPDRTLIFAFVTGHFRLPEFKGTSQATSTWMQAHPELWDGKNGHLKAVAGLTVEHLGSLEWKDNDAGTYAPTGKISTEFTYAGNEMMAAIWRKAIEDRVHTRTVILRGHNMFQFGESQPLFNEGIPVIGFIPMPDYLLTDRADREMNKFDVHLMYEQVESLLKALQLMDHSETTKLGTADRYSFFLGRT